MVPSFHWQFWLIYIPVIVSFKAWFYNQLQKSLPRSLQKIWNYRQSLKTTPTNQKLGGGDGWGVTKLIIVWIRVRQRYFLTNFLKKIGDALYILFLRWYFESIEIATAVYCRSGLFHKTIFLNWLILFRRKLK